METDYIDRVFGGEGYLAAQLPGYAPRKDQIRLARAVDRAMETGTHLIAEGPCGVGKSLAYLVPAIWHARKNKRKVIIVTANIALQEQLIKKDLPFLAKTLPTKFTYSLLKGRSNYVCPVKAEEAEAQGDLDNLPSELFAQRDAFRSWKDGSSGDLAELPFIPDGRLRRLVTVSGDDCLQSRCPARAECPSERARVRAQEVDVVVTNMHLLFAHLALRQFLGEDAILPSVETVVIDEAHEAADIARKFFGHELQEGTFHRIAKLMDRLDAGRGKNLHVEVRKFFRETEDYVKSDRYKIRFRLPVLSADDIIAETSHAAAFARKCLENSFDSQVKRRAGVVLELTESTLSRLKEYADLSDKGMVYTYDIEAKKFVAQRIDVGPVLHGELFEKAQSVCLLSATIATEGNCAFARRELGVPKEATELLVDSPFDFKRQALLLIPENTPDPKDATFPAATATALKTTVREARGRTLGLFTSHKAVELASNALRVLDYRIMRQGDAPRGDLVKSFKEDVHSILLGTDSLWTGVDVPGPALSCVFIDKIPFPRPDDPILDALAEREDGVFYRHVLPRATIKLRQGVGRLIRSVTDLGVVVILDKRLIQSSYGGRIMRSLPKMARGKDLGEIGRFLDG